VSHFRPTHPIVSTLLVLLVLLVLLAPLVTTAADDGDGFVLLFNGRDLSGWVPCNVAVGTTPPFTDTFTVKDRMILCTGVPTGVLRTERMYENFVVELEWRHIVPKGNSGFFLWADDVTSRGVPFSRGLEVQILDGPNHPERAYTTHGDLFPIHGATATPANPGKWGGRSYPSEDRSKPSPEWNHYRIEANGGTVTLAVNGKVVNSTREVSPRRGYLCLESEGGVIHFRNLRIKELPPSKDLDPKHVAIADRGFKTLYNGLNLDGWTSADPARPAWRADDWTLHYDPARANAPDPTLWTSAKFDAFSLIVDVNTDAPVHLLLPGVATPTAIPNPTVKDKPKWRRILVTAAPRDVTLSGDDFATITLGRQQQVSGPIGLRPTGAADFANLYVADVGPLDARADVGKVTPPGSTTFDKDKRRYRLTASGENVWGTHDDFHFAYRKTSADLTLTATVSWEGEGKNPHRKAGPMIRQTLDPDSPYADVVVHGDGLVSLQYRETRGGVTKELKSDVKAPAASVRLERHGETVSASVKPAGAPAFRPIGSIKLALPDAALVGLIVCSHDPNVPETAVFTDVAVDEAPPAR
jgi:hypothetical protein